MSDGKLKRHLFKSNDSESAADLVDYKFIIFLLWSLVLLCRPQDIFPFLAPLRPILLLNFMILILYMSNFNRLHNDPIKRDAIYRKYLVLVCVIALSIPFSYYRRQSFLFLTTIYINSILFFMVSVRLTDTINKVKLLIYSFCLGMAIYSAFVIAKGTFSGGRVEFGNMFDPNDLAFVLVSCWPLNLVFLGKENPKYARITGLAGMLLGTIVIFLTASRGGIIALLFVVFLLMLKTKFTIKKHVKVFLIIGSIALLIGFSAKINMQRIMSITDIGDDYNMHDETGRIEIWKTGLGLMFRHPFTGVGVSCFSEAIGRDRAERGLKEIWQAPHNSFVQIGTETGMLGLILYISITWSALSTFRRIKYTEVDSQTKKIGEMLTIGFYGHLLATMFLSQAYSIYWIFFIVLSIILSRFSVIHQN